MEIPYSGDSGFIAIKSCALKVLEPHVPRPPLILSLFLLLSRFPPRTKSYDVEAPVAIAAKMFSCSLLLSEILIHSVPVLGLEHSS